MKLSDCQNQTIHRAGPQTNPRLQARPAVGGRQDRRPQPAHVRPPPGGEGHPLLSPVPPEHRYPQGILPSRGLHGGMAADSEVEGLV